MPAPNWSRAALWIGDRGGDAGSSTKGVSPSAASRPAGEQPLANTGRWSGDTRKRIQQHLTVRVAKSNTKRPGVAGVHDLGGDAVLAAVMRPATEPLSRASV
jgi:hypothetical protein